MREGRKISPEGRIRATERLVRDVVLTIEAISCVDDWQTDPPFYFTSGDDGERIQPRPVVVFANGFRDVDELLSDCGAQLHNHDPNLFNLTALPFSYEANAGCPLWLQTLDEILPRLSSDDHRIEVVQEFMGYSVLAGETRFEKFLVLVGSGKNGKSTILKVWRQLLGVENVSSVSLDSLGSNFRLIGLQGKLANIAYDMQKLDRVDEGRLKVLTSGEPLQIDKKHKDPIDAMPRARLVFATNELPPFLDRSDGIWRRLLVIPFYQQFHDEDPNIDRQRANRLIERELPGIANWLLGGLRRLLQQNRFTDFAVCRSALEEHRIASDPVRQFVDECVELDDAASVLCDTLYAQYKNFCSTHGRMAKNSADVGKQLKLQFGVTRHRQGHGRRSYEYHGIRFAGTISRSLRAASQRLVTSGQQQWGQ